jgi:hypothetical protein
VQIASPPKSHLAKTLLSFCKQKTKQHAAKPESGEACLVVVRIWGWMDVWMDVSALWLMHQKAIKRHR